MRATLLICAIVMTTNPIPPNAAMFLAWAIVVGAIFDVIELGKKGGAW